MQKNTLLRTEMPPQGMVYALLIMELCCMVGALLLQQWMLFAVAVCLPIAALVFLLSARHPLVSYFLYFITAYYFAAIIRYSQMEGLSVVLDAILVYALLTVFLHAIIYRQQSDLQMKRTINILTVSYGIWVFFVFFQLITPSASFDKVMVTSRGWVISLPLVYILSSIIMSTPKRIRHFLIVLGIFTLIAFVKLAWQKQRGFDATEKIWLMGGAWNTHLLRTGIRYFSLFSDAGNFGSNMGVITVVYGIITFHTKENLLRLFYLAVTGAGVVGLFMSGTRGAIIVPFAGLALYCLLSKNIKVMILSLIVGVVLFSMLAFTSIGEGNPFIRRMRTAFNPTEDASFNVRKDNQKRIANLLLDKPMGIGIGERMIDKENLNIQGDNIIPPDSFYVDLWIQTGIVGLTLYIAILIAILLRCCYIIMFRIKNKELKHTLAAMISGIFGLWINGYVGNGMGFQPGSTIIAAFLAFILNGPEIDHYLSTKQNNNIEIK